MGTWVSPHVSRSAKYHDLGAKFNITCTCRWESHLLSSQSCRNGPEESVILGSGILGLYWWFFWEDHSVLSLNRIYTKCSCLGKPYISTEEMPDWHHTLPLPNCEVLSYVKIKNSHIHCFNVLYVIAYISSFIYYYHYFVDIHYFLLFY